jgi:hypothetical protein
MTGGVFTGTEGVTGGADEAAGALSADGCKHAISVNPTYAQPADVDDPYADFNSAQYFLVSFSQAEH